MIDIRKLVSGGQLIEEAMNISYKAADDIKDKKIEIPQDVINLFKTKLAEHHIFLNNDDVISDIISGIIRGNIVLQGPPGTGKTALAKIICETFNVSNNIITAVEDWTSYDTIGGLFPAVDKYGHEIVSGRNGLIVKSIVDCCNTITKQKLQQDNHITSGGESQATWLIVDELNRAEIDKVFGELFTVFGSSDAGNDKKLALWFHQEAEKKELAVPDRFRIIGTMNNVDKQFVNDMSAALARRFTFITILPPSIADFADEISVVRESLASRVTAKMTEFEGNPIDEAYVNNILDLPDFISVQEIICDLLKHVRYEDDGVDKSTCDLFMDLQIGTAQIKDMLEAVIFRIIINNATDEDSIKAAFDAAFENTIVPLMVDHSVAKIECFKDYFETKYASDCSWMMRTYKALERI